MNTKKTKKMKSKTVQIKVVLSLAMLVAFTGASRAVVVNFGETVPTSNIITFYESGSQDAFGWLRTEDTNRIVAQTFTTPGGSNYLMNSITMKIGMTLVENFAAPSPFTIDFYRLSSAGQNPETGVYLSSQSGTMQPNQSVATAGSYFSFELNTPITLEADVSYGYVLSFNSVESYNILHPAISNGQPDPSGNLTWFRQNAGAWNQADGQAYVYYIQGTAVPEPGTVALLCFAAGFVFFARRRAIKNQT